MNSSQKQHLADKGYVVLPDILPLSKTRSLRREAYAYIHNRASIVNLSMNDYIRLHAPSGVWLNTHHAPVMWKLRTNHIGLDVYQQLYPSCVMFQPSLDRLHYRPPDLWSPEHTYHEWWHWDENPMDERLLYQSFLNLWKTTQDDSCLGVLEGSHHYVTEFFQYFPSTTRNLNTHQIQWFLSKPKCSLQRIACPPGSFVIWNSKCIHSPLHPRRRPRLPRMVFYIRYWPIFCTDVDRKRLKM